ncbi:MAG: rhomboid family intramembrane serine protease [Gammaproteobacteria bacterium]|nr:rhomboid family intramembrane serine protease [Gammaproteobacteria bacterium]
MKTSSTESNQVWRGLRYLWGFIVILWIVHAAQALAHHSLYYLGVLPQHVTGLIGIVTAPFIHGDWGHLANNSLSLMILGSLMWYAYPSATKQSLLVIWLFSGIGVWLFGRESYHYGASGVAYGLFYFLFVAAMVRRDKKAIAVMLVAVLMYGSMVLGVLPWDAKISFEGHLSGAVGGLLSVFLFHRKQQAPPVPRYDWEVHDDLDDEEPYWLTTSNEQSTEIASQRYSSDQQAKSDPQSRSEQQSRSD